MHSVRLLLITLVPGVLLAHSATASAETAEERLESLDQKVKVLERRLEIADDEAKQTSVASASDKGLAITSGIGEFEMRLRGNLQIDSRNFLDDEGSRLTATFLVRKARPIFEGTFAKYFDYRMMPDLAGSAMTLVDAFVDIRYLPAATVHVGKYIPPVSLFRLPSDSDAVILERAPVGPRTPDRDIGVQIGGNVLDGPVNYAIGVFNGLADNASSVTDATDRKDVAARVFLQPWYNHPGVLQGLGVGVLADYVQSSQDVKLNTSTAKLTHKGWNVEVNWVVTGEDASYKSVKPASHFVPGKEGWGAFELGLRYGQLDIDDDAFTAYADPAVSVTQASTTGLVANWYLNRNARVSLDYEQTSFDGGAADGGNRPTEKIVIGRLQLAY